MALVTFEANKEVTVNSGELHHDWIDSVGKKTSKNISSRQKRYPINYEKLKALLEIDGLKGEEDEASTPEAHKEFMEKYKDIFIKPNEVKLPAISYQDSKSKNASIPSNKTTGPTAARTVTTNSDQNSSTSQVEDSHDIRDYTKHLRKVRKDEMDIAAKSDGVKILRRLLRKLPFQRTSKDISIMYKALKTFTDFASMVSNEVLKELCYVAQLDQWKDENFPVFGSSGMHMILKGSVTAPPLPHIFRPDSTHQDFKREWTNAKHNQNTDNNTPKILNAGDSFGTFMVIDGTTMHKNMLMVYTREENCEFLKVTTSDYNRVVEQMKTKEQTNKLNLLQACAPFKMWTRQPKLRVANLIEWQDFPPNTVIVSEGYRAPFIGFVLSGECHILKQLEVLQTMPNGQKEKKNRQVVMDKLGPNESFAEMSILKEEPMTFSIISATNVTLGTISPDSLFSLDHTTLDLLLQSCQPTTKEMTQEKIQQEYMEQELTREWNQYRHNAVIEAINAQGIRPGYGKWRKP